MTEIAETKPKRAKRATLKAIENMGKLPEVPSSDNPREELRRLVLQHKAITKAAVSIDNMARHKKNRETGEEITCRLPEDIMMDLQETAKRQRGKAAKLESAMLRQLRQVPIYNLFLKDVFGVGPIVASYLVSDIDIHRATKPSSLRMFCGLAVQDGRLVRRVKGQKSTYSSEMRTRLYQAFGAMWKNAAKRSKQFPNGCSCKYLQIWENYKTRQLASGRVVDGRIQRIVNGELGTAKNDSVSAKGFVHSTGWHKAADVFLCDLYTIWRALEGLPVWPTYVAWITGYAHGGKPTMNEPVAMTVEQAIAEVGNVKAFARAVPVADSEITNDEEDESEVVAAE